MKICVISTPVFVVPVHGYSGLEHLAWQQAAGLAAKGHQVSLVAPQGSSCPGAAIIAAGPAGSWDEKRFYGQYWQELPKFDVIIDHSWHKWAYILKQEGRLKAPVLGVCHAPINTMYQTLPPIEKPCFVCISQDQANHFQALFSRPARVAYNGVDMDFYKPIPGVKRTNRFLFLARFSTIKGPDLAIDACRQAGVGLDLVGDTSITGEPEFLEQCKKKCDWIGPGAGAPLFPFKITDDRTAIRMVGPANRGECVHWFSQAVCLLHPNQRFREPFGLAPVEAMACGCPVIAWGYGAMRETVSKEGWLVDSQAELVQAVKSVADPLNSPVGIKGSVHLREWAGQFSLPKMIDRYEALCQEAIETGGW